MERTQAVRLGTNLKHILKARRLSLKQISDETQIPYSTLHTWLENRQPKDIVKVKVLADYLEVDFNQLLFGESEVLPTKQITRVNLAVPGNDPIEGVYEVTIRKRS